MPTELDDLDLEMLRKRALDRYRADAITADNAPQPNLGMKIANGLLDLGAGLNRDSNRSAEILSGAAKGSLEAAPMAGDNQARYLASIKDKQTQARQMALDDIAPIKSIQAMIDQKQEKAKAERQRIQDLAMKGYKVGVADDMPSMIPGGLAEMEINDKRAQARQRDAMAKYYDLGKGGGGKGAANSDKLAKSIRDDLDPNKARGGNLAKSQAMINSADRVDALFQQFPDYNIPKGQSVELAAAIAGLVNGGSAQSQHQIDSMTPSSMKGDAQALAGWITNDPTGLDQKQFMKMMHETALRERDVAAAQVKQAQIQRLAAHKTLATSDPETYAAMLSSYGIDPEEIVAGKYAPKPKAAHGAPAGPAAHPQDSEAVAWAKANPGAKQSAAILKANGL